MFEVSVLLVDKFVWDQLAVTNLSISDRPQILPQATRLSSDWDGSIDQVFSKLCIWKTSLHMWEMKMRAVAGQGVEKVGKRKEGGNVWPLRRWLRSNKLYQGQYYIQYRWVTPLRILPLVPLDLPVQYLPCSFHLGRISNRFSFKYTGTGFLWFPETQNQQEA